MITLKEFIPNTGFLLVEEIPEENKTASGLILTTPVNKPYITAKVIKIAFPDKAYYEGGNEDCVITTLHKTFADYNYDAIGNLNLSVDTRPNIENPRVLLLKGGAQIEINIEGTKYLLVEQTRVLALLADISEDTYNTNDED